MSANPEFLDQLDADVPNEQGGSDADAAQQGSGKTEGDGVQQNDAVRDAGKPEADAAVKDKIDPAKPDDKAEKVVPLRALQEEREAAKELKRQIAELQAQPKLTAEDAELLKELKAQRAAQQAPKEVDFLEDPKGYVDASTKKALDALKAIDEKAEKVNSQVTAQQRLTALMGAITAGEQEFVREAPDYYDALNHVRAIRAAQIRLMDPNASEAAIGQVLQQEEMRAAEALIQRGQNPSKFAYEYAKTIGYTKKSEPAPKLEPKPEVDKSAARSMGAGGGDAADNAMDDDDPNAEFLGAIKERFKGRR